MKVYLNNAKSAEPVLVLGEFPSIGVDVGSKSSARMFNDNGREIARMLIGGWRQVIDGIPVGPYYTRCDIEES
jgi:hypothetical protein